MKKLLKYLIPAFIVGLAIAGTAGAQVFTPSYWVKIGNNLYPLTNSSTIIGSSTYSGAFNNITVSGTCTGCGGGATTTVNSASGSVTIQGAAGTSVNTSGTTITVSSTVGLNPASNLSDVANSSTALSNIGGTSAASVAANYLASSTAYLKPSNNLSDVANTSTALSNLTAAGLNLNQTFTGSIYFRTVGGVHMFPTPAALAAGATCGASTGVTAVDVCANAIIASDLGVASATETIFPVGVYPSSTFTNHILCGNLGQRCTFLGAPGQGTILNFGGGTNVSAFICDYGPGGGATSTQQVMNIFMESLAIIGNDQTIGDGQVGIKAGITNGCGHTLIDDVNVRNFGTGVNLAGTNTYAFSLDNSIIKSNGRNIDVNNVSNSGESLEFFNDWIVDPANASSSNCFDFETSATEQANIDLGSLDDCQLTVNSGSIMVRVAGTNFENPTHSTYGPYDYIVDNIGQYGQIVLNGVQMMNDATSTAAGMPAEFVSVGANSGLTVDGVTLTQNGAAGTVTNFVNASSSAILNIKGVIQNGSATTGLVNGSPVSATEYDQLSNALPVTIGPGEIGAGTANPKGPIDGEDTHATATGGIDGFLGDTSSTVDNPVIISHKSAASGQTGSFTVIGFNAYVSATNSVQIYNSASKGWMILVDDRNTSAPLFQVESISTSSVATSLFSMNASGTVSFGASGIPWCVEGFDSIASTTKNYSSWVNAVWTTTTTKPAYCQ